MAERVLFISWGTPVRGSEARGLEVFNRALGLYGRLQQAGRIESFDVMLFAPHAGLNGCIAIRGSAAQLADVREDEEFRRTTVDAALVVDDLRLVDGFADEGVARQMAMYQEALADVPQRV